MTWQLSKHFYVFMMVEFSETPGDCDKTVVFFFIDNRVVTMCSDRPAGYVVKHHGCNMQSVTMDAADYAGKSSMCMSGCCFPPPCRDPAATGSSERPQRVGGSCMSPVSAG